MARCAAWLAAVGCLLLGGCAVVTVAGVWGLGLPLGAAVLLGAVLAPTDPVLANDVQVAHPGATVVCISGDASRLASS